MTPGLHELECKQCGAPIHPPETSGVVACKHCQQPHMWVAPNERAPQGTLELKNPPLVEAQPRRPNRMLWIVPLLTIAAIMAAGVVAYVLVRTQKPSAELKVTSAMPLRIGDTVVYYYEKNSSCTTHIEALINNDTVRLTCQGGPEDVKRNVLRLQNSEFFKPKSGSVVLARDDEHSPWRRLIVVGTEPDGSLKTQALAGSSEKVVSKSEVAHVRSPSDERMVNLPRALKLKRGDVLLFRHGDLIKSGRVADVKNDLITIEPGFLSQSGESFKKSAEAIVNVDLSKIVVPLGSKKPPLANAQVVVERGGNYQRAHFERVGERCRWHLRTEDGKSLRVWCGDAILLPTAADL